jgi:hypothetical protein
MNNINGPIPHSPELAMNAEGTEGAPTGLNANIEEQTTETSTPDVLGLSWWSA